MVGKILAICEFYGIHRPVKDIIEKFRGAPLFAGLRLAKELEDMPFYKGLVENIRCNCNIIASTSFQATNSLINFIVENEDNFDCMVDLFTELGTTANDKETVFRFCSGGRMVADTTVYPYAGNIKWLCRLYPNNQMIAKLKCRRRLGCGEEITVQCHIEVFFFLL